MGEAEGGVPVDLRDDSNVRSAYLQELLDWEGTDLKNVYEPIADQISYIFVAILIFGTLYLYSMACDYNRKRGLKLSKYPKH